jgi:hypothetical protein
MTDNRTIVFDALFMILYIGFSAAMACLTATLALFLMLDVPLAPLHVAAALLNLAGCIALPFVPRVYQSLVGQRFSWRMNGVLGSVVDA